MDSLSATVKKHCSNWLPLIEETIGLLPEHPAAYLLRLQGGRKFGRLKGASDIVYIGSTDRLRRRVRQMLHPGSTQRTNLRIKSFLARYAVELSWRSTNVPQQEERELLQGYLADHDELPPLNGSIP